MSPFPPRPRGHRLAPGPARRRSAPRAAVSRAWLLTLACLSLGLAAGEARAMGDPAPECIQERLKLLARVFEAGVNCYRSQVEKTTFDVPACLNEEREELLNHADNGWDKLLEPGASTCGSSVDADEIWNRAVPVLVQLSEDVQRTSTGNNQLSLQAALKLRSANLTAMRRHFKKMLRYHARFVGARKQKKLDRGLERSELRLGLDFVSAVREALDLNVDYLGIGINGIRLSLDAFAHDQLYPGIGIEPPVERAHQVFFTIDPVAFEYSEPLDRLLVLDARDRRLLRYDPIRTASDVIIFQDPVEHLGLGPDGLAAVVAHPASISIVDLSAESTVDAVVKILPLERPISSIAFIGERKAILLPGSYADRRLRLLDLDEETITVIPGFEVEPFARGRLHPRGDAVYAAGPQHVTRLSIEDGTISRVDRSPDHRGNELPAKLFYSDDGASVFARSMPVLRSDADPDLDLRYGGRLEGTDSLEALLHLPSSGHYLASPGGRGDRTVRLYDDEFGNDLGAWKLPRLDVERLRFPLHVRHLFLLGGGQRYVIVFEVDFKADAATGYGVIVRGLNTRDFEAAKPPPAAPAETATVGVGGGIVGAAASRALGRLVLASAGPDELLLFDPSTSTSSAIALPLPPIAVAVSPDGLSAAVAHDGWVSRVDLAGESVLETLPLTTRPRGLVFAPDDVVHVFPDFLPWDRVRSLDLGTGEEEEALGAPTDVRSAGSLHPDGDSLYSADENEIKKFDVSSGVARRIATSLGRSDLRGCARVFADPAGTRLLNGCGQWIRSSPASQLDLRLQDRLPGEGRVIAHDAVATPSRFAVLRSDAPDSERATVVEIYDAADPPGLRQVLALPRFEKLRGKPAGLGRWVFLSDSADEVHIVVEADPEVADRPAFGIASIELVVE